MFVYKLNGRDECELASGDGAIDSLKEAESQAKSDLENYDSYSGYNDSTEAIIYKLVPVRKITRPTEVVVTDL